MRGVAKFPLYIGVFVLTIAVLVSAIRVSTDRSSSQNAKAGTANSSLSLRFSAPDVISLSLSSEEEVAGVDVSVKFDKNKAGILPTTLKGEGSFVTTGGQVDEASGTFTFSALSTSGVKAGVVATFKIVPKNNQNMETAFDLEVANDKTAVLSKSTGQNITLSTSGVKFIIPAK